MCECGPEVQEWVGLEPVEPTSARAVGQVVVVVCVRGLGRGGGWWWWWAWGTRQENQRCGSGGASGGSQVLWGALVQGRMARSLVKYSNIAKCNFLRRSR